MHWSLSNTAPDTSLQLSAEQSWQHVRPEDLQKSWHQPCLVSWGRPGDWSRWLTTRAEQVTLQVRTFVFHRDGVRSTTKSFDFRVVFQLSSQILHSMFRTPSQRRKKPRLLDASGEWQGITLSSFFAYRHNEFYCWSNLPVSVEIQEQNKLLENTDIGFPKKNLHGE